MHSYPNARLLNYSKPSLSLYICMVCMFDRTKMLKFNFSLEPRGAAEYSLSRRRAQRYPQFFRLGPL